MLAKYARPDLLGNLAGIVSIEFVDCWQHQARPHHDCRNAGRERLTRLRTGHSAATRMGPAAGRGQGIRKSDDQSRSRAVPQLSESECLSRQNEKPRRSGGVIASKDCFGVGFEPATFRLWSAGRGATSARKSRAFRKPKYKVEKLESLVAGAGFEPATFRL